MRSHEAWRGLLLALAVTGLVAGATFLSDGVCDGGGHGGMSSPPGSVSLR